MALPGSWINFIGRQPQDLKFSGIKILKILVAGVAELVDAQDLKSCGNLFPCRFESGPRYNNNFELWISDFELIDLI
jgi:hypothetical protein